MSKTDVPLFVSHRRLKDRKKLPRALGRWCLDSGGFTELNLNNRWTVSVNEYVDAVHRYQEIGGMDWAAPQDWMCEPFMLDKTGKSIEEHQWLTIENFLELREHPLPFIPVLQGWTTLDYVRCVGLYEQAGVDLTKEPVVGLGSVCRRQGTRDADDIVHLLHGLGLKLHGFGMKILGLRRFGYALTSSDSMAWSFRARRSEPMPGHTHKSCSNCIEFALKWRTKLLGTLNGYQQMRLA